MTEQISWMPEQHRQDQLMRLDAAQILKRFYHLERMLTLACAGWVPDVARLESKTLLGRAAWQNAMTADASRTRVLELRYPDRDLETGDDTGLVKLFEAALNAPSGASLLLAMERLFIPALQSGYEEYLQITDDIADGPSKRFLELAVREKNMQREEFHEAAEVEFGLHPELRGAAEEWVTNLTDLLEQLGGVRLTAPPCDVEISKVVEPGEFYRVTQEPSRDDRYFVTAGLYWPDNFDPDFGYGDGFKLQLRSAVAHLNEVWAVETAGVILVSFADDLEWEFVADAARWLYDECRHMLMGKERLDDWGLDPAHIPLGSYIYQAAEDQDPIYRLGMLGYFETKNIGKKQDRSQKFGEHGDRTGQRDMDFDWADEAIHAGYGRKWLRRALEVRGEDSESWREVLQSCEELANARVERATEEDKQAVVACTEKLISDAEEIIDNSRRG